MGLYTRVCSSVLFPLHEGLKGHTTVADLRRLEGSQWLSRTKIEQVQLERLRAFLAVVGTQVPYYRDLFGRVGFDPNNVSGIRDLERLPRLEKANIRANAEAMKRAGATGLNRYNTGGSSGEPLVFYTTTQRRSHDVAAKWRATRWWQVDIGDPEIVVWGSPVELGAQDRVRALRDRVMRSWLLPAFDMSESSLNRYVATISAWRPAMLFGYPSSLSLIACHARKQGARMDELGIKVAFVTSERLYDDQREVISSVFGCPVANGYGGRDAGFIAHECPEGRMHLSAEDIVVEILGEDGRPVASGDTGEIVVTHLATADFPFVRYRTGDLGALDDTSCPCGRGLPVLKEIQGRTTDFVVARDGTVMHGLALIYAVRALPGIERFKILQHDISRTEVLIVPGAEFQSSHNNYISKEFKARLGQDVAIDIALVDNIPKEKSGKFRYVISKVHSDVVGTRTGKAAVDLIRA